jgi:hypothetical protein
MTLILVVTRPLPGARNIPLPRRCVSNEKTPWPLVRKRTRRCVSNEKTPWPLVRKRTIPTEQPPLVDEI